MQGAPAEGRALRIEMSLAWNAIATMTPSWTLSAAAVVWALLLLAVTPVADWIASRWIDKPPTLEIFRGRQQSRLKLVIGSLIAWVLGAFLEEFVFRGIVQQWLEQSLVTALPPLGATTVAVLVAAIGAGLLHLYQGVRAAVIITQLSVC